MTRTTLDPDDLDDWDDLDDGDDWDVWDDWKLARLHEVLRMHGGAGCMVGSGDHYEQAAWCLGDNASSGMVLTG